MSKIIQTQDGQFNGTDWDIIHAETDAEMVNIADTNNNFKSTTKNAENILSELYNNQNLPSIESTGYGIISGLTISAQSTPNMSVNVASGIVHMANGVRLAPMGNNNLVITTADATNPRIDIIYVNSDGTIGYITGIPSSTPTVPTTPSGAFLLGQIAVRAGVTSIVQSNITDERLIKQNNNQLSSQMADIPNQNYITEKADKTYVDTNVSTLDAKINSQASGSPKETFATLADLQADTNANTTDGKKNIYLVTADGKWYYWDATLSTPAWTAGGTYQSTGIADKSVTTPKLNVPYLSNYQNVCYMNKSNYLSPSISTTEATINCNLTPYVTLPIGKYLIYIDVNVSATTLPSGRFVPIVFTGSSNIMADFFDTNGLFPRIGNLQSLNNVIAYGIVNVTSQVSARIGFVMTEQNTGVTNTYTVTANKIYAIKLDTVDNEVIKALKFYNDVLLYVPIVKLPISTNEEQMQSDITSMQSDITSMQSDITSMQSDITSMQSDITSMQELISIKLPILCYGDSMTGTVLGWVNTLANTYGVNIINRGIGGQTAGQIATRQGGLPLIVQPFTIPADTSKVPVTLNETFYAAQSGFEGINPVYINGIQGTLRNSTNSADGFTFARTVAGDSVTLTRPTTVFTDNMKNYRKNPMIIWVGTNGDYSTASRTSDNLIEIIDYMLSYGECTDYLIIGLTIDVQYGIVDINTALAKKYGRRFLDLRSYMIQYGLDDMGWTPTTDDTNRITANNVPSSLLADGTHFQTSVQQQVTAPLIYKKLQELSII